FLLSVAICLVPFGRIADIYGRKRVFTYGIVIYTIASLLCALTRSAEMLIGLRIVQGVGSAMYAATGIAMLTSVFSREERGKMLGVNVAAVYLGLSLGPFIGGIITHHFGWRYLFLVTTPFSLLIIAVVFWKLRGAEWSESKGERFDIVGAVFYGLILVALMYGFSILPDIKGGLLVLAGIMGFILFISLESRSAAPMIDVSLFRGNNVFVFSNLAALINYSATAGTAFLLSFYLQYIKGVDPQHTGMILVAQPVVMTLVSPFAGRLSDRIEPRLVASAGMALTALGLFMLVFLGQATGLEYIIIALVILGIGFGLFSSPNTNAVMSSVDKKAYGIASATLGTMRLLGQMFSMGIMMFLFALYMGRVKITPEYYPEFMVSMKAAFIIFTALSCAGVAASMARGKGR
ncbi:MAG: MFS transporter, partial [Planctomycetota bacterium]